MTCLLLLTGVFVGCISKYRPLQEYRSSKAYRQNLNMSISSLGLIHVDTVFIASGLMRKTKLDKRIPLNQDKLTEVVLDRLATFGSLSFLVNDSIETVLVDNFAFNHPFGRKLNFNQFNSSTSDGGCRLIPYIEMGVFKGVETEGGGGIESITYTGNRIHNITQAVVLTMFCEGEQVFSSGHYITDMYINHKDSVTVYDFPIERLDSLMGLCLGDLEKEIKANQDRLK
jgi:hypothetical protein